MPLYIADYLADTAHLSQAEHGAYLLLIMAYWRNGGPLPDDDRVLRRISKTTPGKWQKMRSCMIHFFDPCMGSNLETSMGNKIWRHKRIDAELENAEKLTNAKRKGGKAAAAKRWGTDSTATVELIASRARVLPSPSPSLPTGSKDPERERRAREAPAKALSQSLDKFEVGEAEIAEAAEARACAALPPANLRLEAATFGLDERATQTHDGWLRWALKARPDPSPDPNGHDPPFTYKPDIPDGPPPPFDWTPPEDTP
jgi:uncharacterized protein YdaU (DUF1376 family)